MFTEKNGATIAKLKSLYEANRTRYVSTLTLYEVYKLTLAHEGRAVASLRIASIRREFKNVDVNPEIAIRGAEISHKLKVPMADALIMATSNYLRVKCVTDDPHFTEVERTWI